MRRPPRHEHRTDRVSGRPIREMAYPPTRPQHPKSRQPCHASLSPDYHRSITGMPTPRSQLHREGPYIFCNSIADCDDPNDILLRHEAVHANQYHVYGDDFESLNLREYSKAGPGVGLGFNPGGCHNKYEWEAYSTVDENCHPSGPSIE